MKAKWLRRMEWLLTLIPLIVMYLTKSSSITLTSVLILVLVFIVIRSFSRKEQNDS
jgi:positive regulator of sigma E activity